MARDDVDDERERIDLEGDAGSCAGILGELLGVVAAVEVAETVVAAVEAEWEVEAEELEDEEERRVRAMVDIDVEGESENGIWV